MFPHKDKDERTVKIDEFSCRASDDTESAVDIRSLLLYYGAFDEVDNLRQLRIEEPAAFKQYAESVFRRAVQYNSLSVVKMYVEEIGLSIYDDNGDIWDFLLEADEQAWSSSSASPILTDLCSAAQPIRVQCNESIKDYIQRIRPVYNVLRAAGRLQAAKDYYSDSAVLQFCAHCPEATIEQLDQLREQKSAKSLL